MEFRKKYQIQDATPYPHIGQIIGDYMKAHNILNATVARRIGIATNGIGYYLQQESLQLGIIWKVGVAVGHNFLAEIAEQHPYWLPSAKELKLESEIEDLKKELEIYKRIVGK
ncbi:hypothetical protein [Flavobacterium sp. 3HN19-14]|uniref:hypothetical protein n=1 Tax=Flavobacterium sp. 3HN19-14 TaxID=3448133 RepID=UPI003EDEE70A